MVLTLLQQIPGFVITSYGMSSPDGYYYVITGQALMGACNVLSWALPASTASIWFAKNEVTAVVAVHVVAKGLGESLGSFVPTAYVDVTSERMEVLVLCSTVLVFCNCGFSFAKRKLFY